MIGSQAGYERDLGSEDAESQICPHLEFWTHRAILLEGPEHLKGAFHRLERKAFCLYRHIANLWLH